MANRTESAPPIPPEQEPATGTPDMYWWLAWWLVAVGYALRMRFLPTPFDHDAFASWWNVPLSAALVAMAGASTLAGWLRRLARLLTQAETPERVEAHEQDGSL